MLSLGGGGWLLFQQLLASGVVLGSWYALLGVSMGVIYSTTRTFHIAHSIVYTAAGYGAVVASNILRIPLPIAVLVGISIGIFVGFTIDRSGYRGLRRRDSSPLVTFLFSLGLTVAITGLIQIVFGPDAWPLEGYPNHSYAFGDVRMTTVDLTKVFVCWALIGATVLFLRSSKYGRAITAVRTNQEMAAAVGVDVERVHQVVFILGSGLVACASLLFCIDAVASPNMGLEPALLAFVVVFIGGVGDTLGAAIGGLFLGCITDLSGFWLAGEYSSIVAFTALFATVIVRPRGLLSRAS